jgi:hypothetical protein
MKLQNWIALSLGLGTLSAHAQGAIDRFSKVESAVRRLNPYSSEPAWTAITLGRVAQDKFPHSPTRAERRMERLFGVDETELAARQGIFKTGSERVYRYMEEASFSDAMRTQIISAALRTLISNPNQTRSPQILAFADAWFRGDEIVYSLFEELESKPESHSDIRGFLKEWEQEFKKQRLVVMNQRFDEHVRQLAWASLIQEAGRQEGFSGVDSEQLQEQYTRDLDRRLETFRNDKKEAGLGQDQRSLDRRWSLRYTAYLQWAQLRLFPWETTRAAVSIELEKMRRGQLTEDMRQSYINGIISKELRKTNADVVSWHTVKNRYEKATDKLEELLKRGSRSELQAAVWEDPVHAVLLNLPTATLTRAHIRKLPLERLQGAARDLRIQEILSSLNELQTSDFRDSVLKDLSNAIETARTRDIEHLKAAFEKSKSRYENNRRDVVAFNTTRLYDLAVVFKNTGLEKDGRIVDIARTLLVDATEYLHSQSLASGKLVESIFQRRSPEEVANQVLLPWTVAAIRRVQGIPADKDSKEVSVAESTLEALRSLGNEENIQIKLLMFTRWQLSELLGRRDLEREVQIANEILRDQSEQQNGVRRLRAGVKMSELQTRYGVSVQEYPSVPMLLGKNPSQLKRDENISGGLDLSEHQRIMQSVVTQLDPDSLAALRGRVFTSFDPVIRDGVRLYQFESVKAGSLQSLYDSQLALQDVMNAALRRESTQKLKRRWLERDYVVSIILLSGPLDGSDAIQRMNAKKLSRSHEFLMETGDFAPTP